MARKHHEKNEGYCDYCNSEFSVSKQGWKHRHKARDLVVCCSCIQRYKKKGRLYKKPILDIKQLWTLEKEQNRCLEKMDPADVLKIVGYYD